MNAYHNIFIRMLSMRTINHLVYKWGTSNREYFSAISRNLVRTEESSFATTGPFRSISEDVKHMTEVFHVRES